VRRTFGGTRADLLDCALAAAGRIAVDVERLPLADGLAAFDRLTAGTIVSRAVLVP
jgi:D-arabinose 1-dehydrogenase-like Zn-dependent alcohol dehydrogenase